MSFQIFLSYARKDDLAPPGGDPVGFVTALQDRLQWEFESQLGPPVPDVWRDKDGRILPSDQFDEVIQSGIVGSDVLLVVLSNNWINRPYCVKELELFERAHRASGNVKKRIIVVAKHDLALEKRPDLLTKQSGYRFYDDQDREKREFFPWPECRDDFNREVRKLAEDIQARARQKAEAPAPSIQPPAGSARKVFVAKPATDMAEWYEKLVDELVNRGFAVVPDRTRHFSAGDSAAELARIVDDALDGADVSIHVLGENAGFVPTGDTEPIVQFQLSRAAAHRQRRAANGSVTPFQRLIWAPKIFITLNGGEPEVIEANRVPQDVFERWASLIDGDSIEGSQFTQFKLFVVDRLTAMAQSVPLAKAALGPGARVYLQFQEADESYAAAVADGLAEFALNLEWSSFSGDDARLRHQKNLIECDAVVVCWANGADSRVWSAFDELQDPRKLGREADFKRRSLVAGPPKDVPGKYMGLHAKQKKKEVDLVLDLTAYTTPPPDKLRPLIDGIQASE